MSRLAVVARACGRSVVACACGLAVVWAAQAGAADRASGASAANGASGASGAKGANGASQPVGASAPGGAAVPRDPPPAWTWIAPGESWSYTTTTAIRPTRHIGAVGLAALDRVRADGAPPPTRPSDATGPRGQAGAQGPTGAGTGAGPAPGASDGAGPGPVAPAYPALVVAAEATGVAPLGASGDDKPATVLAPTDERRIARLALRRRFRVGAELANVRVLELRIRYRDAVVVSLNGREIARRNLDPGAPDGQSARRVRGPEWESFYVELVSGLVRSGENELSVDVRPHGLRATPSFDLELVAYPRARIVRGPIVQRVSESSAVIVFETDAATTGEVRLGEDGASERRTVPTSGRARTRRHVAQIDGLAPGREIHYRVATSEATSSEHVLHTAPTRDEPLRFVVYGDVRSGHDVHARVLEAVQGESPDLVLTTGDMVLRGSDEADWQRYFDLSGPLMAEVPVYPTVGNHDLGAAGDAQRGVDGMFELPPGPEAGSGTWYSFDVAGVHFVVLDSNHYDDPQQRVWLGEDLAAARTRGVRAVIVTTHHGPWSRGLHGGSRIAVDEYVPVLVAGKATLLFSGHDHLYQRGRQDGLAYVVTGGGGAGLYQARCGVPGKKACAVADGAARVESAHHYVLVEVRRKNLKLCAKRPDGTVIEKCTVIDLASE